MRLKQVTLFNATAAGNGTAFPLDWVDYETQLRTVVTNLAAADTIAIQGTVDGGTTWAQIASHNAAGIFADTISGPWQQLRVVKTGALGNATVVGLI